MDRNGLARKAGLAIALLALCGLVLRYGILLSDAMNFGESPWGVTRNFFSYFSILTNLLVVMTYLLPSARFRNPRFRGSVTLYIVVVGVVYELMLRGRWHLEGFQLLASCLLHDAVPLAVLIHWALYREAGSLKWTDPFTWLAFPLGYLAFALARGAFSGWWAYPFINVSELGYARVLLNTTALVVIFILLGLAMVAWDRRSLANPCEADAQLGLEEEGELVELPSTQSW